MSDEAVTNFEGMDGVSAREFAEHLRPDILYAIKQVRVHRDLPRALDALERMSEQISAMMHDEDEEVQTEIVGHREAQQRARANAYLTLLRKLLNLATIGTLHGPHGLTELMNEIEREVQK
jgi:hypothetical protein